MLFEYPRGLSCYHTALELNLFHANTLVSSWSYGVVTTVGKLIQLTFSSTVDLEEISNISLTVFLLKLSNGQFPIDRMLNHLAATTHQKFRSTVWLLSHGHQVWFIFSAEIEINYHCHISTLKNIKLYFTIEIHT